ncbi:MAG: helix-turn-helix domain-containing protein [Neisseriaceae bacterium]|nr:helix-turn-helix domain-containing protein [Neisseriaceae bacterium]
MKLAEWLEKNKKTAELARALGVGYSHIYMIKKNIRPVPVKYCKKIVQFTNNAVTLADLRPNDWRDIWDE